MRLAEYITEAEKPKRKNGEAAKANTVDRQALILQRTADYIVDAVGGGGRATALRITNCQTDDIGYAIAVIVATQKMNERATGDRTYHLMVSFPPGEKPALEQLRDIEDELCRAIGLNKHQRVSAVHLDTEHLHMHIAINQIHPETYALIEPFYDKRKLMRACERLEIKHNLTRTNHRKLQVKREQLEMPAKAVAMERHSGLETLLNWVRGEVKPALMTAVEAGAGWHELHRTLAEHGLEIRRRAAGLIITDGKTAVKASDVDRLLSLKALQDKWGSFVRADPQLAGQVEVKTKYRRGPMHRDVDELFEDWQRSREKYNSACELLDIEILARANSIKTYAKEVRAIIHKLSPLNALGRSEEYQALDRKVKLKWANEKQWAEARLAEIRREYPVPTWPEFLRAAASNGNAAALRALRRNAKRHRQAISAAVLPGAQTDETVIRELKPEALANGTVVYTLRDGGKIADNGVEARIERDSHIARALAVTLMASRSRTGEVGLDGPAAQGFIEAAARDQLQVHFSSPDHERERLRLIPVFEREEATLAATVFIAGRNAARASQPDMPPHRLWQTSDAGTAAYEATEPLGEGAHAVLLRKGEEILVLPRTASEATASPAPGTPVEISAQGDITARKGQQR